MPHATRSNFTLGPADWTNARFADGRKVAAYLHSIGEPRPGRSGTFKRTLYACEHGRTIGFMTLDGMLTRIGIHPSELPDDVWMHRAPVHVAGAGYRPVEARV